MSPEGGLFAYDGVSTYGGTMAELFFGDIRFDTRRLELEGPAGAVEVRARARELLLLLIENRHRFVSKEEILETVWSGVHVADSSVAQCISELRHALRDDPKTPRYIETRIKGGYRFVAPLFHRPTERLEPLPWNGTAEPAARSPDPGRPASRFPLMSGRSIVLAALVLVAAVVIAAVNWSPWSRGEAFGTVWIPPAIAEDQEAASLAAAAAFDRQATEKLASVLDARPVETLPPHHSGTGWLVEYDVRSVHSLRLEARVTLRRWPSGEERWGWSWCGPAETADIERLTSDAIERLAGALETQR